MKNQTFNPDIDNFVDLAPETEFTDRPQVSHAIRVMKYKKSVLISLFFFMLIPNRGSTKRI